MSFNPNNTIIGSVLITKDLQVDGTAYLPSTISTGCLNTDCVKEVTANTFEIKNASDVKIMEATATSTILGATASTAADSCIAIGDSGFSGTGQYCIAMGYQSGGIAATANGSHNIAIGYQNLFDFNAASTGNVAIGKSCGSGLVTGALNVFMGSDASTTMTTGNANIVIGDSSQTGDFDNQIILGQGCVGSGADAIAIGTGAQAAATSICVGDGSAAATSVSILGGDSVTGEVAFGSGINKLRSTTTQLDLGDSTHKIGDLHMDGTILSNSGLTGQILINSSDGTSAWVNNIMSLNYYGNYGGTLGAASTMVPNGTFQSTPGTVPATGFVGALVIPNRGLVYAIRSFCDGAVTDVTFVLWKNGIAFLTQSNIGFTLVNGVYEHKTLVTYSVNANDRFACTWAYNSGANPNYISTHLDYAKTSNT